MHLGSNKPLTYKTICLPARAKTLIEIPLKDNNLSEGYIRKISAGPGVFIGETIVARSGEVARCNDVQFTLAPVEIEECTVMSPRARTSIHPPESKKGQKERATKFARLLKVLNLNDLDEEERLSLLETVGDYLYQFHLPGDKLGATSVVAHKIVTYDSKPVFHKNYRYPSILRNEVRTQVDELLAGGIVRPSDSPYNSPLWIVPKKPDSQGNKHWRMVIDYRALNEKTVGDAYPLPNITDILDQLGGAKYFSVLDLASGFHQIPMDPGSRAKTAFSIPFAYLEFTRMPFGLKNAPATFQRLMDRVLSGLQGIELFVYMDDIVVYGISLENHASKLRVLLGRLKEAGLALQPEKCHFLKRQITYLGHVISEDGVKPDPRKIEAVKNFPVPKRRKNIKQFVGLVGYYRRFIPDFARIAKPLNSLLKEGVPFQWTDSQQIAFETLRDIICSEPLLQYPDFTKPFVVTTDASNYALGAVLSQGEIGQDLPIAYASRTLKDAEVRYFTTEKKLLAIVFAVQHFRPYLYGRKFLLVTDHRPLVWLHNLKDPNSRLGRWKIKLSEYDYTIVYKPGKINSNADALSRNPCDNQDKGNEAPLSPPFGDRIATSAGPKSITRGMGSANGLEDKDLDSVKLENLIEYVFLSRGALCTTGKEASSDGESDSEAYDTAPDEDEQLPQVRRTKVTKPRAPLGDIRDPVSANCTIARYGAPAVGMRYSNPGNNGDGQVTVRKDDNIGVAPTDLGHVAIASESDNHFTYSVVAPSRKIQGPQVRYAEVAPSPLQASSGERGESTGDARETSRTATEGGLPDSGEYTFFEREGMESGTRVGASEYEISTVLVVAESCVKYSKDKLLMGKGHIVNFISNDCTPDSQINKELIEQNMISVNNLKAQNPQLGETVVYAHNGRYIFNVVVKVKNNDRPSLNDISRGIESLKEAMIPLKVECVKFSKVENGIDNLSWSAIEQIIQQHFVANGLRAFICSGEIRTPEKTDREKIIREAHESTVGGHKGVSKTYWRIRADLEQPENRCPTIR